jgi:NADH-quinone oxidoreductase subunit G
LREGLRSQAIDTLAAIDPSLLHRLARPDLQASVPDLEFAHTVLVVGAEPVQDMPILDLRIRKGVRRHAVKLALATPGASALDPRAELSLRYAPGADAAFLSALATALYGGELEPTAAAAGADVQQLRALAELLRTGGEDIVILYGERVLSGAGNEATDALLKLAGGLGLADRPGAGLLVVPASGANARGLLEAGVAPGYGPGLAQETSVAGPSSSGDQTKHSRSLPNTATDAPGIAAGLAAGELTALYLLHADPLRSELPHDAWSAALEKASTVIAHASFLTAGIREHAHVVFPAESYAEKEGTIVHPDGRIQRLRPAIAHQGSARAEWSVLAELALRVGLDTGVLSGPMATQQLVDAVPFYAGLTLEEIGGRGVRWQERPAAAAFPDSPAPTPSAERPTAPVDGNGVAAGDGRDSAFSGYPSLWSAPEVEFSPALQFLYRRYALGEPQPALVGAAAALSVISPSEQDDPNA